MKQIKKVAIAQAIAMLLVLVLPVLGALVRPVYADNFAQAYLRADRMKASTATSVLVVFTPVATGTEAKVKVTFAAGYTVGATPTGNVSNLPSGVTAVPGTLTYAGSGQVVTISGVTDLTPGTSYGVNIATGITNTTAGEYENTITTTTSGDVTIDSSNVAVRIISDDQIVLLATVPPTFNFVLSGNTDAFTTDLASGSIVSTTGKTVTLTTNADKGWIAWVKSANAALSSATTGESITTTGTVNAAPSTLSAGTNGYVLDTNLTTDHGTGTGTVTIDAEYNGTDTSSGGTLSTSFQPIASANGTTAGDVITLIERAAITTVLGAADDYTDTLTVVGAGNF
ncbi:hypothetical protein HY949_04825 [Candidatus Gottesmanbacteria bacterium]|nr:hypothetical protein [Candidatus Gottesmanbacteria bacterium]